MRETANLERLACQELSYSFTGQCIFLSHMRNSMRVKAVALDNHNIRSTVFGAQHSAVQMQIFSWSCWRNLSARFHFCPFQVFQPQEEQMMLRSCRSASCFHAYSAPIRNLQSEPHVSESHSNAVRREHMLKADFPLVVSRRLGKSTAAQVAAVRYRMARFSAEGESFVH